MITLILVEGEFRLELLMEQFVNNPMRDSQLISPIDGQQFSSQQIRELYATESLTQDEFVILEFYGVSRIIKEGTIQMSFQGLKRLTSLHQAKLTKAINRLVEKGLLIKADAGYKLTKPGIEVFSRLYQTFNLRNQILPKKLYTHVANGQVQGLNLTYEDYEKIADSLVGKWFGRFRFTSKIEYEDAIELGWITTNGSISATLIMGPDNNLRLSISASIYDESQTELQILINHVSQSIESIIDAPTIFNSLQVFENHQEISTEINDAVVAYAG